MQLVHLSLTIQQGGAEKYDPTPRLTTNSNSANWSSLPMKVLLLAMPKHPDTSPARASTRIVEIMTTAFLIFSLAAALQTPAHTSKGRSDTIPRRDMLRFVGCALLVPAHPAFAAASPSLPTSRGGDIAALKMALLARIPATTTGAPATNATLSAAAALDINDAAAELEEVAAVRGSTGDSRLDGSWRLVYSDAPEITNLTRLPAGFRLGPVHQPFDLAEGTFENQGAILHVTGLVRGSTRVVGEFSPAPRGSLNAAGVVNNRDDRVDVNFRRVVFQLDAPLTVRTVVTPKRNPALAHPAVDTVFLDDDLRVTRGGDGSLFVLVRDESTPTAMMGRDERRALYALESSNVAGGAGLGNWSRTTPGVFSAIDGI